MRLMLLLLFAVVMAGPTAAQERDNTTSIYFESLKRAAVLSERQAGGKFQYRSSVPITTYDPVVGREGSTNRLLLYLQLGCAPCKDMWATISEKFIGSNLEIRILFVPASFPESGIITLYECASRKAKAFGRVGADFLFAKQPRSLDEMMPTLRMAGMSMEDVTACLKNEAHYSSVAQRREILLQACGTIGCVINAVDPAKKLAVFSTPTWILETGGPSADTVQARNNGSGNAAKLYDALGKIR